MAFLLQKLYVKWKLMCTYLNTAPFWLFFSFPSFTLIMLPAYYHQIYFIRSYIVIVFWLCCVKTKLKSMGFICYTWKKLGTAPCGNPTRLKFGRDTHYSGWLRGRILGQRGAGFNKDIPWKHNQIELLLCVSYISCEKQRCSRDPISVSAAAALLYVVPVNYIQYERARLSLMDLKQSKRKHWYIVQSHTHTHTDIYCMCTQKINLMLSLSSEPSMSRETTGNSK